MRATILIFVVEQEKLRTTCIRSVFERELWRVLKRHVHLYVEKSIEKKILWNLHRDKAIIMSYF